MNIFNILNLSFFNLLSNKKRTFLTILGMVIGISSIIVLYTLGTGLNSGVNEQLGKWGSNTIFVLPGKNMFDSAYSKLSSSDSDFIKGLKGVDDAFPLYMSSLIVKKGKESSSRMVLGLDPEYFSSFEKIGFIEIAEGRKLIKTDKTSIIISRHIAENFTNKELKLKENLEIGGKNFTIVGISKKGANLASAMFSNSIILPLSSLKELSPDVKPSRIFVVISEGAKIEEVISTIKNKLKREHGAEDFLIMTPETMMEVANNILWIIQAFLLSVSVIALIIGALGIANTVYMSVYERTTILGVMKAIGATKKDILLMIVFEAGILGFFSGILGLIVGLVVSFFAIQIVNSFGFSISFFFSLEVFFIAAFVSFTVGVFAGYGAAKKAADMDAVEAIYQ